MSTPFEPSDLLVQDETAVFLRSKPRTLEGWRARGVGPPFVRVGRRICYRRADLVAWLNQRRRTHTKDDPPLASVDPTPDAAA